MIREVALNKEVVDAALALWPSLIRPVPAPALASSAVFNLFRIIAGESES